MTEALQKLSAGAKFDDVAREFSEDKARAGGCFWFFPSPLYCYLHKIPIILPWE
jgi:hypothetical protein